MLCIPKNFEERFERLEGRDKERFNIFVDFGRKCIDIALAGIT